MLSKAQASPGQELALQQVKKYRRDVCRLAVLVHRADLSPKKELAPRGERVYIWRREHRNAIRSKKSSNVAQEADGALDVLNHFHGSNESKRAQAKLGGKIRLVQVQTEMGNATLETLRITVDGKNLATDSVKPGGDGTGAGSQIDGAHLLPGVFAKDTFLNELVKTTVCQSVGHLSYLGLMIAR